MENEITCGKNPYHCKTCRRYCEYAEGWIDDIETTNDEEEQEND